MTAVIYARYSSDNQREESIEGQIRECTAYAEKNGITIVKTSCWSGNLIALPGIVMTVPGIRPS